MTPGDAQDRDQNQWRQQKRGRAAQVGHQVEIPRMVGDAKDAVEGPGAGEHAEGQHMHQWVAHQTFRQTLALGEPGGAEQHQQIAAAKQQQGGKIKVHGVVGAIQWLL